MHTSDLAPRIRSMAALLLAAGLGLASGCGGRGPEQGGAGDQEAGLQARDLAPGRFEQFEFEREPAAGARLEAIAAGDGAFELVQRLEPDDWRRGPLPNSLEARLVVTPVVHGFDLDGEMRLVGGATDWRRVPSKSVQQSGQLPGGDAYSVLEDELYVASRSAPAETLELRRIVAPRRAGDGTPTVLTPGLSGPGLLLFDGVGARARVRIGAGEQLVFFTGAHANPSAADRGPVRFEVLVDGEPLAAFEQSRLRETRAQARRVDLAAVPAGEHELEFRMRGPDALGAVVAPRLEPGLERPSRADDPRPDLLLFIADTFRADNLSFWRGSPGGPEVGLTPFLDGLVERSLAFRNTWSAAAATLPGHASLFTSMYPAQHGLYTQRRQLALDAPTLAARLRAAGYRTVAISDGGNCSALYGFDQGFEVFLDGPTDMARTASDVQRVLEVDDPRPLFLFVQTYRVHSPYEPTEIGRARVGDAFEVPESYDGLMAAGAPRAGKQGDTERFKDPLRALYLAGVASFDAEFEGLWASFEAHGFGARHLFALTSDHGEAFGEHGRLWHGFSAREQQLRVPLFLLGAGVEPGVDDSLVSLVDLAPTLTGVAGVEPAPEWIGRDLLHSAPREVIGAQVLGGPVWDQVLIAREGKLHQRSAAETRGPLGPFTAIFSDPQERESILPGDERWPAEFVERVAPTWDFLVTRMLGGVEREVSADELAELQALGYLLEED